jgi:predicted GH43/DUF377 family glycosyl hydrolase
MIMAASEGEGFGWGLGPFRKHPDNPILGPQGDGWESRAVFNPAAWTDGEQVYLLYRAEGPWDFAARGFASSLGLAVSRDGVQFAREAEPVLVPTELYELPGGCEDPRLARIDGRFYLTYTAYDGMTARLVMAVSDDLRAWEKWGPLFQDDAWDTLFPRVEYRSQFPRGWSKSGAILPEKVGDEYWMYFGDKLIWAAHSRDLRHWAVSPEPALAPRADQFDALLVEPGPPPVLRSEGIWLGYNAADAALRYTFGQALFDADDPARLLRRSARPLLEPTTADEVEGQVPQVVFGEGMVFFQGRWLLYYGMADSRIGVAVADNAPPDRVAR